MTISENTKTYLVDVLREEYTGRLTEVIGEVDLVDNAGNILVTPGLKVRHKSSGYEYTVAGVAGDGDNLRVKLRLPDEPRFEPPPEGEEILAGPDDLNEDEMISPESMGGVEAPEPTNVAPLPASTQEIEDDETEVVFYVDEKDFEKDYEVD